MRPLNPYQTTASVQALAAQQPPAAACAADEEERQRLEGAAGAFARRAARGSKLSSSFSLREQILCMDVKSQPLLVLARESSDTRVSESAPIWRVWFWKSARIAYRSGNKTAARAMLATRLPILACVVSLIECGAFRAPVTTPNQSPIPAHLGVSQNSPSKQAVAVDIPYNQNGGPFGGSFCFPPPCLTETCFEKASMFNPAPFECSEKLPPIAPGQQKREREIRKHSRLNSGAPCRAIRLSDPKDCRSTPSRSEQELLDGQIAYSHVSFHPEALKNIQWLGDAFPGAKTNP